MGEVPGPCIGVTPHICFSFFNHSNSLEPKTAIFFLKSRWTRKKYHKTDKQKSVTKDVHPLKENEHNRIKNCIGIGVNCVLKK